MKCNHCFEDGIENSALGKSFWYCRNCKSEITESSYPLNPDDGPADEEYDQDDFYYGFSLPILVDPKTFQSSTDAHDSIQWPSKCDCSACESYRNDPEMYKNALRYS